MILDIGTEEIGHVEMLATMIARLLETSPVEHAGGGGQELGRRRHHGRRAHRGRDRGRHEPAAPASSPDSARAPTDSVGFPWMPAYTIASGNLLADFRFNVTAESQGRLQVAGSTT